MDLLHTGSDELVCIQTDKVSVIIKGQASHPSFQGIEYTDRDSTFKVFCSEEFDCTLKGGAANGEFINGSTCSGIYTVEPLFFEQQRYEILIEAVDGHTVAASDNYRVPPSRSGSGRRAPRRILRGKEEI